MSTHHCVRDLLFCPVLLMSALFLMDGIFVLFAIPAYYLSCNESAVANVINITRQDLVNCNVQIQVPARFNSSIDVACHILTKNNPRVVEIVFNHAFPKNCMILVERTGQQQQNPGNSQASWKFTRNFLYVHWVAFLILSCSISIMVVNAFIAKTLGNESDFAVFPTIDQ